MKVHYGWVVVGAGMLISCIAMGSVFSLAVFLQPIGVDTGWSRTGISTAMTLVFLAMGFASFGWGALTDRIGTRLVVLMGAGLMGLGMVLASRAADLLQFQILFGVIVGIAGGAFYAPLMTVAAGWFEQHRSLAVALISAGMGMAPLIVAPTVRWLITDYEWRTAMLIVGIGAAVIMIPAALLIRRPPVAMPSPAALRPGVVTSELRMTAAQAFRTSAFVAIALTHFACCAAHSGPIFHMVAYAMGCGIAPMAAVSVYSLAGLSGLGGRLVFGLAADKFGAKQVLVLGLVIQALAAGTYVFVSRLGEFYALAVVFALAYGGVMPLYAILVRDYFGMHIMGTVFGAVSAMASLGMAFGPLAGGWVYDTYASYSWLYIGSLAVGLGAVAIALTFKPRAEPLIPPPALRPA